MYCNLKTQLRVDHVIEKNENFELSLIDESIKKKKPLRSVCG